jgi:dynein heavy chain
VQSVAEVVTTSKGTLYDSFYDRQSRKWVEWSVLVPEYNAPQVSLFVNWRCKSCNCRVLQPFEFYRILVPTSDNVLYTSLLSRCLSVDKPCLFVGESGTAKTVTIQSFLGRLEPERTSVLNINFSSRTTSRDVQVLTSPLT